MKIIHSLEDYGFLIEVINEQIEANEAKNWSLRWKFIRKYVNRTRSE